MIGQVESLGGEVTSITMHKVSLEAVFSEFTGRSLRAAPARKVSLLGVAGLPPFPRWCGGKAMTLWAIMRRDLRKLGRNPITLLSTILMPIVYLVIIGNSFQGNLRNLALAAVSQDHGEDGRRMVEKLQALAAGPKTITLD